MIRTGKSSSTGSSRRAERERLLDEEEDGYSTEGQRYIEILEDDEESDEEPPRSVYVRRKDGSLKSAKRGSRYCGGKWRRKYCSFPRMRSRGDGGDMPMYGGPETYQEHPAFLHPSAGLHYSYIIVMALLLSTVVQLSRGGLLAYEQKKDPHSHDHDMHPNYTQHGFSNIRGSNNLNSGYYGNWGNHMMMGNMGPNMNNNGMVPMMRGNMNDHKMNEDDTKKDKEDDQKKIEKDGGKSSKKIYEGNATKDSTTRGEDVDDTKKESSGMTSVTQLMNNPMQNGVPPVVPGMDSVMQSMNNPQSSNDIASGMNMPPNAFSPQNMNSSMQGMPPNASSPQNNMNNPMQNMPPNASSPQNMNNPMQNMPPDASSPQNMNSLQNMNNPMQNMSPNASSPQNMNSLPSAGEMSETIQNFTAIPNAPTANAAAALAMTPVTPTSPVAPVTPAISTTSTTSSLPELPPPAAGSQSASLPSIPPPEAGSSSSFFASPDSTAVVHKKVDVPNVLDPNDSLPLLNNYKDTWDPWDPSDVPMFFHIPKSGGSSIKDIMGTCHRFTLASEFGVTDGHINDTEIAVVYPKIGVKGAFLSPFVNIDATTIPGINRAISMGFPASNHLADVVVSPYLYEASDLFTPTSKGRLFSVFRHPNERSLSLFYYLQYADW